MLKHNKISLGRVRQAYGLTETEANDLLLALWPDRLFPLELWRKAYESYWQDFARANQQQWHVDCPVLPELCKSEPFRSFLFAQDMQDFVIKLSPCLHARAFEAGLDFILEETFGNAQSVYPEERKALIEALTRNVGYSPSDYMAIMRDDTRWYEKTELLPPLFPSMYGFIGKICAYTILVDKIAVIEYLLEYPLCHEVKGITRKLVDDILKKKQGTASNLPQAMETIPAPKTVYVVPDALWMGVSYAKIRDDMRAKDYPECVIAHVLVLKRKVQRTQAGRLLTTKKYSDDKSYRNIIKKLLKEAATLTIKSK